MKPFKATMKPPAGAIELNGNGANATSDPEELAQVVVSTASEHVPHRPWYVVLRPWLFCMVILAVFEAGVRAYYDTTLCLRHDRFDTFASPALEDMWVSQIARDKAFKIVFLGDSVGVAPKILPREQTIPYYLEQMLQKRLRSRDIHVWNMSLPGVRPADQFCILLKLLRAKPDMIVITANVTTFTDTQRDEPMLHPWLADNLPQRPNSIPPPSPPGYKDAVEGGLRDFIEKHVRIIGLRQSINSKLFGDQPRMTTYDDPNPFVMTGARLAKAAGALKAKPFDPRPKAVAKYYDRFAPPISPQHPLARYYPEIFETLRGNNLLAFAYLTPQNPAITSQIMTPEKYRAHRNTIAEFFRDPAIRFEDFSEEVPPERFKDNDHMLPAGNRQIAEMLAERIGPLIAEKATAK